MSASAVSITANPAARRRPVVAFDKNTSSIEFLPGEPPENFGDEAGNDHVSGKDLSHHSIRSEAVLERTKTATTSRDPVQAKRNASAASPRRGRRGAVKAENPHRWAMAASVFGKNFVLLILLIGLVQFVRKVALKSGDNLGTKTGFSDFEGRISETASSVKRTARMFQLQLEVMDKKIQIDVGGLRKEIGKRIEDEVVILRTHLEDLVGRTEGLEKSVGELKHADLMSKEEFKKLYGELKKGKGSEIGDFDVSLDELRAYAREIVQKEIEKHAADGLGRVDYAVTSGGGMVVKHSEAYVRGKVSSWFPLWPVVRPGMHPGVHPDAHKMLRPSFGEPGQCFSLKGNIGFVQIRLRAAIVPEAVTLEHVAKSVAYDRSTAPKDCRVSGWLQGSDFSSAVDLEKMFLLTEFTYDLEKSNAQTFNVLESAASYVIDTVRLDFASNHGSSSLTCIYRFRVHGYEPESVSVMAMQQP